jgi:hypothetical protein
MSDDTPSPLNNVITIDDERIKSHLDRVARGIVEETLNALLDAEADRLYGRQPLQLWSLVRRTLPNMVRSPVHRCETRKNRRYRNSPRTRWQRWRIRWLSVRPRPHNLRH